MSYLKSLRALFIASLATSALFACKETEVAAPKTTVEVPAVYDAGGFTAATTTEKATLSNLADLEVELKKAQLAGIALDSDAIDALLKKGTPSLEAQSTSAFAAMLNGDAGLLAELKKSSGNEWTPEDRSPEGGVYEGRLLDEGGVELLQVVLKGMFGATLYESATDILSKETLLSTDIDKVLALYGASPEFPNADTSTNTENPDKFLAKYAARRDNNDGTGLYRQIETQFKTLQATTKGGAQYILQQKAAVADLKILWERANAATVINYLQAASSKLSATSVSDADKASALHSYGEAVGFLLGWEGVDQSNKIITSAQVKEVLTLMKYDMDMGNHTAYMFVTEPVTALPEMLNAIEKIQSIYGFTDSEVEGFKKNWVSEQQR